MQKLFSHPAKWAFLALLLVVMGSLPAHAAQQININKAETTAETPASPEEAADASEEEEKSSATAQDPMEGKGGAGDLLIAPTRVVLDDKKRTADVLLNNKGEKETTFRISLVRMRMLDNGDYEQVKDEKPGEAYADEVVRYSPRQVTLKPGQSQSVKFAIRNLDKVAAGEYRIHAMFRGNPDESQGTNIEHTTTDNNQIAVRLVPVYGVTIPVIVRHGDLNATASLSAARSGKKVALTINRQGNRSLYGDVVITAKTGGREVTVGQLRGVSVFVPNKKRMVQVELAPPDGVDISNAALSVSYRAREDEGGKVLAETAVRG